MKNVVPNSCDFILWNTKAEMLKPCNSKKPPKLQNFSFCVSWKKVIYANDKRIIIKNTFSVVFLKEQNNG